MNLYWQAITQHRSDSGKIYSLHKPFTVCIAKGKAHKNHEFGYKVGLLTHPTRRVILTIKSFEGNPHDSKTIESLLEQIVSNEHPLPREVIYDRGGSDVKETLEVKITIPTKVNSSGSAAKKSGCAVGFGTGPESSRLSDTLKPTTGCDTTICTGKNPRKSTHI
jgi:IS5 family transposase